MAISDDPAGQTSSRREPAAEAFLRAQLAEPPPVGSIAFFAPDFTEVPTIARALGFREHGLAPVVFSFRRARYNKDFKAPWDEVELGRTVDGHYLQRLTSLLRAFPTLWRHRHVLAHASAFYGRNIDQLLLAIICRELARKHVPVVYEVLDIAHVFTRGGSLSAVMRWIERRLLRYVDLLVVSSAAFHRNYFCDIQKSDIPCLVMENKLHPVTATVMACERKNSTLSELAKAPFKWRVGYFGLIRGQPTFNLMRAVAKRCPEVVFHLRGILTTIDEKYLDQLLADHPNVVYGGGYVHPTDLASLYGSVDFSWTIDLERPSANSRWLMPCRFYEAGLLGVPSLCLRGFEVGHRVETLKIGWAIDAPFEDSLVRLLNSLTRQEYDAVKKRLQAMPKNAFVVDKETTALCEALRA